MSFVGGLLDGGEHQAAGDTDEPVVVRRGCESFPLCLGETSSVQMAGCCRSLTIGGRSVDSAHPRAYCQSRRTGDAAHWIRERGGSERCSNRTAPLSLLTSGTPIPPAHTRPSGPHPAVPEKAIDELRRRWLGADRRAGQGFRNTSPDDEDEVFKGLVLRPKRW